MSYSGSCHCGAVTFEVAGDPPTEALSCNCSHCRRKGFLLSFQPADALTITAGGRVACSSISASSPARPAPMMVSCPSTMICGV